MDKVDKSISMENLKRRAKVLAKENGIKHSDALDILARERGFASFRHLQSLHRSKKQTHVKVIAELCNSPIPIKRVLIVPQKITFEQFHIILQMAFCWSHSHLFSFRGSAIKTLVGFFDVEANGLRSGEAEAMGITIRSALDQGATTIEYVYDFGDNWRHSIKFETYLGKKLRSDSVVVEDAIGRCPPEDCGGISGFKDLLDAYSREIFETDDDVIEGSRADYERWLGSKYSPFGDAPLKETQAEIDTWAAGGFRINEIYSDDADLSPYFNWNPQARPYE